MSKHYVIAYDIGTTGNKTCLYKIEDKISMVEYAARRYPLSLLPNGGAEQNPNDWWNSMCDATKQVLDKAKIDASEISAISFCSQMQCVILVDKDGNALRPAISYMDKRATSQFDKWRKGPVCIAGVNVDKLLTSLSETGIVAASAKDPVFKYTWVKENEPEVFNKVYKWLDAKDYLIARATGKFTMTQDSAFATLMYSSKKNKWSEKVCTLHGVNIKHMPEIIKSTDCVAKLTKKAALELGLTTDCKVFGGGGDSSLIGVGTGSTKIGDTHIYTGTSGWVSTVVDKPLVDVNAMIAAITGVNSGRYNYFAEMETSGKCLEWLRDNIVLDNIGAYRTAQEEVNVITKICEAASESVPGAGGVIFLPWLLGNRCPFEDADCRGGFFNINLHTRKTDLARAVIEGLCYHKKWMLDAQSSKIKTSDVIRLAGGGAQSPIICQILSDIIGRKIEVIDTPQNAGALGAAVLMSKGLGHIKSLDEATNQITVTKTYTPNTEASKIYNRNYQVFKRLHKTNKINFAMLNKNN